MIIIVLITTFVISMSMLDDKIVHEYSPFFSFCKELDRKMEHFPDKGVTWLKVYMNLALPCLAAISIYQSWEAYQTYPVLSSPFIISTLHAFIMFVNCVFFRDIDKMAYYINFFSMLEFFSNLIYKNIDIIGIAMFSLVLWGILILINLSYFYKKRELFSLTKRELSEKYTLL